MSILLGLYFYFSEMSFIEDKKNKVEPASVPQEEVVAAVTDEAILEAETVSNEKA